MFKLRDEHLVAMAPQFLASLEGAAIDELVRRFPDEVGSISDVELRQRIRTATHRAFEYGWLTNKEVLSFVIASFYLDEEFDTDGRLDWVQPLLQDRRAEPDARADFLMMGAVASALASFTR